ncbi:MAG: response regulator [Verrucomicrobia bacterium]|nr:response regulator [Verrucomicrobiota bacterium]
MPVEVASSASLPPSPAASPVPPSPTDPNQIKARVELVRMAFRELRFGTVASTLTAVAFAGIVSSQASTPVVWAWLCFVIAAAGARFWLAWAFMQRTPSPEETRRWALAYVVATSISGLLWGVTPWLFSVLHDGSLLGAMHMLMLAGITAGAARLLLPMRKGSIIYLTAILAPVALYCFARGDLTGAISGVCVVMFGLFIGHSTQRNHQTLSDALVHSFERESMAEQLTAEVARREAREVELREATEKAELASKSKSDFLAVISHEIRTPMNGVLGMLRVVRDTDLTSEQRGYLKTASDSAEALLLLLNDVLDFSKIEAGRLELEAAPFPPATMARSVIDLLHARARDKGLALDLILGDSLPGVIIGDSARLRQVLVNLIGNAIKFTDKGKVELFVDCVERTPTKAMMHFTVKDTGIGIDSAAQERLFKPFTQADSSMSRKYGGTGLGLAISQRISQAMGGALQVSSVLNKGSTFRVIVPCQLPDITVVAAPAEAPKFVTPTLKGRVLVVEDDSVNQQVIDLFLKKMNLTPSFAPDGEVAIEKASPDDFDIVLMDCQLPGIDGMEATRQIRQKLAGRPLTIVALTANASTTVRESCLAAGMNDFLSKPVRFELLAGVLSRHLPPA